jgi:hypothetical protein
MRTRKDAAARLGGADIVALVLGVGIFALLTMETRGGATDQLAPCAENPLWKGADHPYSEPAASCDA